MMGGSEFEQALYTIEHYKQQVENMTRQRQMIMLSMEEHMRARLTITEYSKSAEGHDILVPIGANTFTFAKASRSDKVLIGIGGDVIIEDTAGGAMEKLDSTIKILEDADKRIAGRIAEMERQMVELNSEVERAVAQQGSKNPK